MISFSCDFLFEQFFLEILGNMPQKIVNVHLLEVLAVGFKIMFSNLTLAAIFDAMLFLILNKIKLKSCEYHHKNTV